MLSGFSCTPRAQHRHELLIHARPDDSLLWSFPLWLLQNRSGVPVLLEAIAPATGGGSAALVHRAPAVMLGGQHLTQLLPVIETLHEQFPRAGIWPAEHSARARARDACAGLMMLCHANYGAARSGARAPFSDLITNLRLRLRHALDDDAHGAVAAVAAAAALLPEAREWLSTSVDDRLIAPLTSPAALTWLEQPQIQVRAIWAKEWNSVGTRSDSGVVP